MWIFSLIIQTNGTNPYQKMRDQEKTSPFITFLAENDEITYEAYVSEQNLVLDDRSDPIGHPLLNEIFKGKTKDGLYLRPVN